MNRDDRVAAQLKKVVLTPHLLDPQHLLPDGRQLTLVVAARGFKRALADAHLWRGQHVALQLAVRAQRHALDKHHLRRHHVIGQAQQQMRLNGFTPRGLSGRCIKQLHIMGHQIRHQLMVECHYHGFLYLRVFLQARFDFTQLNA